MTTTRSAVAEAIDRPGTAWSDSLTGQFLEALFAAYEEESVRFAVLRNYQRWPEDFGSDVDIVIHRNDLNLSDSIIRRLAPRFGLVARARPKRSSHVTYYLLRTPVGGAEHGILLDFRIDLVQRGFVYLPGDLVLNSARRLGAFYVPSPALESLALLLHCTIREREIRDGYRRRLRELGPGDAEEFRAVAETVVGRRLARRLLQALANGTPDIALRLRRRLLLACAMRNPEAPGHFLRAQVGRVWDFLRRWARPPGALVVFVGPDGSGKSTVAETLCRRFAATRVPVSLVYLGAQEPLLPTRRLSRRIRKRLAGPKAVRTVKDVNRHGRLRGLAHILADKCLRYVVHVRPRVARGEIVLLDRYFYDFRSFPHPLVARGWVGAIAMRLIPKPVLAFSMRGDPAVIAARKHELTAAETARQIACYETLGRWLPGLQVLPADGDLDTVIDRLSEQVLRIYAAQS